MIKKLFTFYLISSFFLGFGQNFKKEKRIYMLDITKSMWGTGGSQNIFNEVKNALYQGIQDIKDPETIITIIPFQATHTYDTLHDWTFKAGDENSLKAAKSIINSYSTNTVPRGYTDIFSALITAKENIDDSRVNYIFLLTDGEQSSIPSATKHTSKIDFSKDDLVDSLNNWCDYSKNKETHLFYVMLSEAANNKAIVEIINKACNAYAVEGTNMNIAFVKPNANMIKVNLIDNPKRIEIGLKANNWKYLKDDTVIKLSLKENSIFELEDDNVKIVNKKLLINIKIKDNLTFDELRNSSPIKSNIFLTLSSENDLKILNPDINIIVNNKKERVLTLEFSEDE